MKKYFFTLFLIILISFSANAQNGKDMHLSKKERAIPKYLKNKELKRAELYKNVLPSVVTIYTTSNSYTAEGSKTNQGLGSGVLISHDCYILTAAHVVDGSSKILVKTQDGKERKASVLFSEKTSDIALLQLDVLDSNLTHAVLGDSDALAVGQDVFAIGSPYGLENSFSSGIISSFRGFNQLYDGTVSLEFLQTDAAINSGNSGGPLFNSQGKVVGIASSILTVSGGFQGIGMAVTINTAKDLLAFKDRPWIGIDGILLSKEELSKVFNLSLKGGLLVQNVSANSPADKAGLKGGFIAANLFQKEILLGGDIILKIGDQETCHVDCIDKVKSSLKKNKDLEIKYLRDGKVFTTTLDVTNIRRNFLSE